MTCGEGVSCAEILPQKDKLVDPVLQNLCFLQSKISAWERAEEKDSQSDLKLDEFGLKTVESAGWMNERNPGLAVHSPVTFAAFSVVAGAIRTYEIPGSRAMILPFLPSSGAKIEGVSRGDIRDGEDMGSLARGGDGVRDGDEFFAYKDQYTDFLQWSMKPPSSSAARHAKPAEEDDAELRATFASFANDKGVIDTEGLRRLIEDYDMSDAELLEFMEQLTDGADTMTFAKFKKKMGTLTQEEDAAATGEWEQRQAAAAANASGPLRKAWIAPDLPGFRYMDLPMFKRYWIIVNSSDGGVRDCRRSEKFAEQDVSAWLARGNERERLPPHFETGLHAAYMDSGPKKRRMSYTSTLKERDRIMAEYMARKMYELQQKGEESDLYTEEAGQRKLTAKGRAWIKEFA